MATLRKNNRDVARAGEHKGEVRAAYNISV